MNEKILTTDAKIAILKYLAVLLGTVLSLIAIALSAYIYYFYESVRDNSVAAVTRAVEQEREKITAELKRVTKNADAEAEKLRERIAELDKDVRSSHLKMLNATSSATAEANAVQSRVAQ